MEVTSTRPERLHHGWKCGLVSEGRMWNNRNKDVIRFRDVRDCLLVCVSNSLPAGFSRGALSELQGLIGIHNEPSASETS